MSRIGIVLSAHGTVADESEIPAFLARIRHGRPTPPAIVAEVTRRYRAIGGSPLLAITEAQARGVEARLGLPALVAMRLARPSFEEALAAAAERGIDTLVSLPLAPQSVDVYHDALRRAVEARRERGAGDFGLILVPAWGTERPVLDAFVDCVRAGLAKVPAERRARAAIVLSAHSLPLRIIQAGDPYEAQFRAIADAVTARLRADDPGRDVRVAFQSQGLGGGAWLGPDLPATFDALAGTTDDVVVAPIGFVSDHVETLYDLDVEAVALAKERGLTLARAPAPNDAPGFLDALAWVVRRALGGS